MILAMPDNLFAGLGVAGVQLQCSSASAALCTEVFYVLHNQLRIRTFAGAVSDMAVGSPWQAMARETLLEDIEIQLRRVSEAFVASFVANPSALGEGAPQAIASLLNVEPVAQWHSWLDELVNEKESDDISLYHVTLRQLTTVVDALV